MAITMNPNKYYRRVLWLNILYMIIVGLISAYVFKNEYERELFLGNNLKDHYDWGKIIFFISLTPSVITFVALKKVIRNPLSCFIFSAPIFPVNYFLVSFAMLVSVASHIKII